jgi:hypothetical protein
MHPYQDQINKLWEVIKLRNRAAKGEFWIEAIALTYVVFEVHLRLLLTSGAGEAGIPLSPSEIDKKEYLRNLANLALDKNFINSDLNDKILTFNRDRNKMIHHFIQGKIQYSELKNTYETTSATIGEIQSQWLKITVGPLQRLEDYKQG